MDSPVARFRAWAATLCLALLASWPLDQIPYQPQFAVQGYETLPDFGSDHRAVVPSLCHQPAAAQAAPELLAEDLAEAEASIDTAGRTREALAD